jgi:large subunit ribosomal protein L35
MQTFRRIQGARSARWLTRGNATLTAAQPSHPPPPPAQSSTPKATGASLNPAAQKPATAPTGANAAADDALKRGRPRPYTTSRPPITLERPRKYMRPVGRGVLPAYDLALKYIKKDSGNLKNELAEVKAQLDSGKLSSEEADKLTEKAHILEVQSEINLPSVRWKMRNGLGMYLFWAQIRNLCSYNR